MNKRLTFHRFSRILLINEIRDTLTAIFPPPSIARKLGRNASLTGALAIVGLIATGISTILSFPSFFAILSNPDFQLLAAKVYAWSLSIAVAAFMFVIINLFASNLAELVYRWGNPSWSALVFSLLVGCAVGYMDYHRMIEGTAVYAERLAGAPRTTHLPMDELTANMRQNYLNEIAELKRSMSWCAVAGHGKGKIVPQGEGLAPEIHCKHSGCTQLAFGRRGQSKWHGKQFARIDQLHAAVLQLDAHHQSQAESYRQLAESQNAARAQKQAKYAGFGETASTWLYTLMLVFALVGHLLYVEAAKKAGLAIEEVRAAQADPQTESSPPFWQQVWDHLRNSPLPTAETESRPPVGYPQNEQGEQSHNQRSAPTAQSPAPEGYRNAHFSATYQPGRNSRLVKKEKNRQAIWQAIDYLQKKEQTITAVAVAQRTKLNERTVRNHFKEMFPK